MLEAAGSVMTNSTRQGYPGKRYYGGCEFVRRRGTRRSRATALFGADACQRAAALGRREHGRMYLTLLKPGDTVLGMNLAHGGHLTHGHPLNFSGKCTIVPYGVRRDDERIDYDAGPAG